MERDAKLKESQDAIRRKEAEAAGRVKQTKQQANAGKSAKQKKEELKTKKAADKEKKSGW